MSIFNFELLKVPFASGAVLSEIEPFPDYVRGLGIAFEQTDGKPEMKGLNGLFNAITASMLSLRQRGISEWVTGFDYPVGAFSVESGKLYQAKTLNTSKQPSISQSDWTLWASVSDITVHENGNIKKTNSPNGAFELKVEDASTTAKGAARFATPTEVVNKANVMAAVTPANIGQAFGQSLEDNGWCRLPNGLILQWGSVDYASNPGEISVDVVFPTMFAVSCLNITATRKSLANTLADGVVALVSKTRESAKFQFNTWAEGSSGLRGFSWFAIGY